MSKIHEALKRAAGRLNEGGEVPPEPSADDGVDSAASVEQRSEPRRFGDDGRIAGGDESVSLPGEPPDLPLKKLRAYRLQFQRMVVTDYQPKSLAAEQFRTLRTRIQNICGESRCSPLLVTSPGPGEGKSLVSVNLSLALAQEMDVKVLLMDCDLRRPSVTRFLGMEDEQQPGLSEYLEGRVPLDRAIWRCGGTNLHVITAGAIPDNPSEKLGSRKMERTLLYLARQFDHVVMDAPPLNPVADPAILIPMSKGVLTVVRYGRTGRASLEKALGVVPNEKHLGVVFNAAELRYTQHYYAYNYGNDEK